MGTNGLPAERNDGALLLRVKRAPSTDDGIVFAYLASQRQPQTELACEAMRSYWLPLALKERGVKGKSLKSAGQRAIAQLMQQIEIIRLECGLRPDEMPFGEFLRLSPLVVPTPGVTAPTATTPSLPPTVVEDTGDGDEELEDEEDDGDGFDSFGDKLEDGWMV
ncbi:hypothetical protein F7734_38995 [Scytonema sp. UIC 10036]|uniref:hypothetical protein n=1 Tax=Scytonema sp. UIC 10036 TaxID=2304196 RepID=UPI0012DA5A07|nr:hypothetical protein [Scytonema sp. UIC 10036]MUG97979.1 hypothetical protein [Scytonema sp. UIC 10036]